MKKIIFLLFLLLMEIHVFSQYDCFYSDFPEGRDITVSSSCDDYTNYIPDEETTTLEVKINFHFFRNDDGTGLYQPSDMNWIDTMVSWLNSIYKNLQPPTIPTPGLDNIISDSKIAFKLMGVYYHDNSNYYSSNMNVCSSILYDNFGVNKGSEINVFFYLNTSYSNGGGCGNPNFVNMHNIPKESISLWANTQLLAHELGHSLGLPHTWNDSFDDTFYPDDNTFWLQCNNTSISNNIMGYNMCRNYLSPKQLGYIHWKILTNPNRIQYLSGICNETDSVFHISEDIEYTHSLLVNKNVIIDSGSTLTILCTMYVGNSARIIVRPGGTLIVDGGTLTSACAGEMWQGIEVVGDRTKHQTAAHQGTVILRNNATIENAHFAVRTGLDGNAWLTAGGIVQASNATFKNNRRSVEFYSYADTLSSGNIGDNKSWFKDCTFTLDDNNLFLSHGMQFLNHVTLWDVKGVSFEGCTFENITTGNIPDRMRAIYAEDAGLKIKTLCNIPDNCVCYSTPDSCLFTGFQTAVEVNTTGSPYTVTVDEAKFTDNGLGVSIQGCNYASVTRCVFDLSDSPIYPRGTVGLFLGNSTGYLVEGNAFTASANANSPSRMGIVVDNSGIQANSIYLNKLKNLDYGIVVRDTNGSLRSGLCLTCDTFENCTYGIYVEEYASVAPVQGSLTKGADNKFLGTQTRSLWNDGVWQLDYYYSSNPQCMLYHPLGVNQYTNHVKPNSCLSTLCGPVGPVNPETNFSGLDVAAGGPGMPDAPASQGNASDTDLQAAIGNYYSAVRRIMADSVESLQDLAAWHMAAGVYADPYSLTEIGTTTGNAAGVSNMAQSQAGIFSTSSQMSPWERDNYADFRTLMDALRPDGNNAAVNWPAATPAQIDELQRIAEANTGRSSTMAKGVLCFFFDICYEEDEGEMKGRLVETFHGTSLQDGTAGGLLVYPNPTDNLLNVESADSQMLHTVWVYDSFGRMVAIVSINSYLCTVDLHKLERGIYFIQALKADGGISTAKVMKN